jgi:hypothetical protein
MRSVLLDENMPRDVADGLAAHPVREGGACCGGSAPAPIPGSLL